MGTNEGLRAYQGYVVELETWSDKALCFVEAGRRAVAP